MKTYHASKIVNGKTFTMVLLHNAETCFETVSIETAMGMKDIHEAEFDTACLGNASRDGYVRTTLASVAESYMRNPAFINDVRVK